MDQIGPHNARNKAQRLLRTQRNQEYVRSLKERSECADCGTKENLTFDHLPGFYKIDTISNLIHITSLAKIKREIAKCRIVCLRCHRYRENLRGRSNHRV